MQPDPRVFLPAIRHEVLRADLFGAALKDGLSPILMMRAGEGLAQLALRYRDVPGICRSLRAPQAAVLEAAISHLDSFGFPRPPQVARALESGEPHGLAGEEDVRVYELFVDAISASIAALAAGRAREAQIAIALAELCRRASMLESEMRRACKHALDVLKREMEAARADVTPSAPAPTDAQLTTILRERFSQFPAIEARTVRPLPGVNAQEIFFFELANHPEWPGPMVLRRASAYNPTRSLLADEFALLKDLHGLTLPVPRVLMVEPDPAKLGGAFLMMERLQGKPQTPEGMGKDGRAIASRMAEILARLHRIDAGRLDAPHRNDGQPLVRRMESRIDSFYRRWEAERIEGSMVLESAFSWLRARVGDLDDRVVLVHGDCNFRNVLLDGSDVVAVLDWELAHLGHAAEDLAYIRPDVEKLMPWSEFLDAYVSAGSKPVSEAALRYFDVWRDVWRTSMAAWVYAAYVRGEHRNFIFGTVAFHEYYATLDTLGSFMAHEAFRS